MRFTILLSIISIVAAQCNCGSGLACCNSQCYNPQVYSCPTDPVTGNSIMCTAGGKACNGACYNPNIYSCSNGGLVQGASPATPATSQSSSSPSTTCQSMFASLQCRTTSENPAQVDSNAVANARAWLCGNYGQFCTAISTGGAYATCNSVEQLSYAMNAYYNQFSSQGSSACNFGGVGALVSSSTPTPTTSASNGATSCQTMFASLQCRTASEDPTQVNSNTVANSRGWLCSTYPQYCTAIVSGGQYASCNSVEQISYAMNQYYLAVGPSQGAGACNFGGLAQLVSSGTPTSASPTPTTAASTSTSCQSMFASLQCRTASEDPTQVNSNTVANSRGWLCSTYPQYCTAIVSGGQYASCNSVEQISYAMNQYYLAVGPSQGSSACNFGGLAQLVSTPTPTTAASSNSICQTMFSQLTCRTASEDPTQLSSSSVSGSRSWLCSNYPQFCTAINSGGQYSGCNSVEQLSWAMNSYYTAYGPSQGASACNFGGVGQIVGTPATTGSPVVSPTPSPSNSFPTQTADLRIINNCKSTLWFEARYGGAGAPLPGQSVTALQALPGSYIDYTVPDTGLSGSRFWAKYGCDNNGQNCLIGDQMQYWPNPPGGCPPGGCTPPIDSLFEATWGCRPGTSCNAGNPTTWFDTSQVDGWTIPYKLTPVGDTSGCDCIGSSCGFTGVDASTLDVSKCPSGDNLSDNGQFANVNVNGQTVSLGSVDERIIKNGSILGCMSPCKRLNWGTPYGMNQPENSGATMWMCCPTPTPQSCSPSNGCVTPNECRAGPIVNTQYVAAVHAMAPGVYAYSYDDGVGLHACPAGVTKYAMEFCPAGSAAYPGKA